jgi:uncharacterized RDD family membrane protein YckC
VAVDRSDLGSWLQGRGPASGPGSTFPGERLGRPESGPRSIAGTGRRLLALIIDWLLCLLIARGIFGPEALHANGSLVPVGVLVVENLLLVGGAGATLGMRLVGVQVERVDGRRLGLLGTAIRSVLLGLGFPALSMLWEPDRRGLHELLSGSLVALR